MSEAFMTAARIVIQGCCGTMRRSKALLDGTADIAMASGAVPEALAGRPGFGPDISTRTQLLIGGWKRRAAREL